MRTFVLVLASILASPALAEPGPGPANGPDAAAAAPASPGDGGRLKSLVERTGLKTVPLDEGGEGFAVPYEPKVARGRNAWVVAVQYANPNTRNYVLVFAVLLKLDDADEVPKRLLKAAMEYNSRTPGSKLGWNRKAGTLDVQYEMPAEHVTPGLLSWAINDVAATCDEIYARFADLAGD